ncbi:MAG: hypothetical protein HRU21_03715 [Pseudomonadales bacterium]|nr:hypothetical protein [Pseudomonadales bacterium]
MSDAAQAKRNVQIVYILQAVSFLVGITFIVGFIWNILKKDEAKGTFAESHMSWQMNTFIYAVVGAIASYIIAMILPSLAYLLYAAVGIVVIIRIVKGWLAMSNEQSIEPQFVVI